jgi:hypothetical protein
MKTLNIRDLRRVARRMGITVKTGPKSQSWAEAKLIHLGPRHHTNPHVLAHEIAHCVNDNRASWRLYHGGSSMRLALRCEEGICDLVADTITGKQREGAGWAPVTSQRAIAYCALKAQVVINVIREVHEQEQS